MKIAFALSALLFSIVGNAQLRWQNVDSLYGPLPASVHVYKTTDSIAGKPNIAYYVIADLKDKKIGFRADTTYKRRLTPTDFLKKNLDALVVVNTSFFSFSTHQNLNLVIDNGKMLGYNTPVVGKGKDTFTFRHPLNGALGITRKRKADIAWVYTDSSLKIPYAIQFPMKPVKDSSAVFTIDAYKKLLATTENKKPVQWKMDVAVSGGPVILQNGVVAVSNNEELKFAGKAIDDRHPRTAMGYTYDDKLIILVVAGRKDKIAEGATLTQLGEIFKDLGAKEALNLDGGGSSCLLINGKTTIEPSDKEGQRMVPGVFIITQK